jgi:hypothetical protein
VLTASTRPKRLAGPKPRAAKSAAAARHLCVTPPGKVAILVGRRNKYVDRPGYVPEKKPRPRRAGKPGRESGGYDVRYLAAARELRDRYLKHVNTRPFAHEGKYDVSRAIGDGRTTAAGQISRDGPAALPPVAPAA